ncbi:aldo/keto reductase [Neobacillus sp. NPDC058068]|uniref:aldo/keto reductase n=1 Tax=Neobacillus sp. NPDC058068 TaxID=3346325 RepID=UPI0036DBE46E
MKYRNLGNTDVKVSEVGFGTWAIGGDWGKTDDKEALRALHHALDAGVNFLDTADVYGGGHSEQLIAKATKGMEDVIHVATKFCRAGNIYDEQTYSEKSIREYCENSLKRLERERIDLYQIHCPPFEIIKAGHVFEVLDKLQQEGKIRYYGVSVETVEEGLEAIKNPNVRALQVIFNLFRQKPLNELFPAAKEKGVGILARVPLASGLLTGKFSKDTRFEKEDHRHFNRDGQQFNVGETFAGLEFKKGIELAEKLKWIGAGRGSMTRAALKWILEFNSVSCVIPGFKNVKQVEDNLGVLKVPSFTEDELTKLQNFYLEEVENYIRGPY